MEFWYDKLACKHCGQTFSSDGIHITVLMYGIFFLTGKNDGYIGTTCPVCLKTIYSKFEQPLFEKAVEEFNGLVSIGQSQIYQPLHYFSPSVIDPFCNRIPRKFTIIKWQSLVSSAEKMDVIEQGVYRMEEADPGLIEHYYCSYSSSLPQTVGPFVSVLWFLENEIEELLSMEQAESIRMFPRYMYNNSEIEHTYDFAWQHYLSDQFYQAMKSANHEALQQLAALKISPQGKETVHSGLSFVIVESDAEKVAWLNDLGLTPESKKIDFDIASMMKGKGIELDESTFPKMLTYTVSDYGTLAELKKAGIIRQDAILPGPALFDEIISQNKIGRENEFDQNAILQKILVSELLILEIPPFVMEKNRFFGKVRHPFSKSSFQGSWDEFQVNELVPEADENERQKQIDRIKKYFNKGYAQDYLSEHYLDFIKDYVASLRKSSFSYVDLWLLKINHLDRYYDHVTTKRCEEADYAIIKEGKAWKIIFNGRVSSGLTGNGFEYIYYLVSRPGETFSTNELDQPFYAPAGQLVAKPDFDDRPRGSGLPEENDSRELTDPQAISNYKDRLRELSAERSIAADGNDQVRLHEIDMETASIKKELSRTTWKGDIRKDETDEAARNKKRIVKAIERAVKSLKSVDGEAFDHFLSALKPINSYQQCYNPTEQYAWHLKKD